MRIQHNIMAMNAYRNYTNNVSAMKANLEKLSSGYKINRAGDDAAGLAISEKMRAQITGLETAQKNAKDGISLVQTAEGALTEVHDMLNRMVELATQSANGTYDDTTDRNQLQKEMDQLKSEINRIADSANFNGIKLLNGDLDGTELKTEDVTTDIKGEVTQGTQELLKLPAKGDDLSVNTVLHKDAPTAEKTGTTFSVDLHNTVFSNVNGRTMTLKVGDNSWDLTGDDSGALKGEDLVNKLVETIQTSGDADGYVEFGGQKFKVEAGEGGDNRITFTQVNAPTNSSNEVTGDMAVEVSGDVGSDVGVNGTAAVKAVYTMDLANADSTTLDATATVDGVSIAWSNSLKETMEKFVAAYNDETANPNKKYVASWDNDTGKLTMTAKLAGAVGSGDAPAAAPALANFGNLTHNVDAVTDVRTLDLTGAEQKNVAGKVIDGVTLNWTGDLDTTMKNFVDEYNATDTKEYTAAWADGKLTLTAKTAGAVTGDGPVNAPTTDITFKAATNDKHSFAIANANNLVATDTFTINGTTYTVKATAGDVAAATDVALDDVNTNDKLAAFIAKQMASNDYDISSDGANVVFTAKTAGTTPAAPGLVVGGGHTGNTLTATDTHTAGTAKADTGGGLTVTTAGVDATTSAAAVPTAMDEEIAGADADGAGVVVIGKADYNFETTAIKNVTANSGGRLASTYFDLTADMVQDGGSIQIGKDTYTFSSEVGKGDVYIGDLLDADGKVDIAGNLGEIANRITDAAKGNSTWTVGNTGTQMSFVEVQDQKDFELTSVDNIAKTFGWTAADSTETTTKVIDEAGEGKSLTLQIGDTAEDFNQLKVNIRDMHVDSLGLEDVKISDQESAAAAVDAIKAAINKVSDVRGTLGATQNRLDHTINNLSVMTENIQDAESTIRDTDVADEMMKYTKNNILIQSAQAMLAQANQVPQGVLQLLQ